MKEVSLKPTLAALLFVCVVFPLFAADTSKNGSDTVSFFSLRAEPSIGIPVGAQSSLLYPGGALWLSTEFALPFLKPIFLSADVGFDFSPIRSLSGFSSLELLSGGGGLGAGFRLSDKWDLSAYLKGGYSMGFFLPPESVSGGCVFVSAGLGLFYSFSPRLAIGVDISARYFWDLLVKAAVAVGVSYEIRAPALPAVVHEQLPAKPTSPPGEAARPPEESNPPMEEVRPSETPPLLEKEKAPDTQAAEVLQSGAAAAPELPKTEMALAQPEAKPAQAGLTEAPKTAAEQKPAPKKGSGIEISEVSFDSVFPVFFKYYDTHAIGTAKIHNWEDVPVDNIKVRLTVKEYMSEKKLCTAPDRLAPGEEGTVEMYGLFTEEVLKISEGTKVLASISVEYNAGGQNKSKEFVETLRFLDRNAIIWDDSRRAAAFVTAKDSTVMKFAKTTAGAIKDKASKAVNANLLMAIGIHEALALYGMSYVIDPNSSYAEYSKSKSAVDFLQFPQQTLEFKAGDCDDLSILTSALLEAVGVESAFITIPGHIFIAFSLGMKPDEARNAFLRPDELIYSGDKTWVPVEVTQISGGFLKAWEVGAKEWRENDARNQAELLAVHQAWARFEPVGFVGSFALVMPVMDKFVDTYVAEVTRFIDREIYQGVAKLQAEITKSQNKPEPINKLGVLYAKYGLKERATKEFSRIIEKQEYVPALINLGNIAFLDGDMKKALQFYERAQKKEPDNPKVLLWVARANHELENYGTVREAYSKLQRLDAELAAQFAYLDLRGDEANRAEEISQVKGVVIWDED